MSALSIRIGDKVFTYVDEEAEAINRLIVEARIDEIKRPSSYSDIKWFTDYQRERISELEQLNKGGE